MTVPPKSQPLVYRELLVRSTLEWLTAASVDDLIRHGVIARQTPIEFPLPEGKNPYAFYLELGVIQQDPKLPKLQIACQMCPHVSEKKAIAWIFKLLGGAEDPARIKAAFRVVRQTMLDVTARELAEKQTNENAGSAQG
jgi:hypothetical protein